MNSELTIIGISGSLREGSYTRQALNVALRGATELGARTRLINLNDYDLPFCTGKMGDNAPAGVRRLRAEVQNANGLVLGTPEYHGSYSGVLKNALDLLGFDEFEGKVVGLVGVSGGVMGGLEALNDLQKVLRALHAWVVPEFAALPRVRMLFNAEGQLQNPESETRLLNVGRQVARFAYLHNSQRALDFLHEWEQLVNNPGGTVAAA
jgi:NAD(P)H-dependent FMN reductase